MIFRRQSVFSLSCRSLQFRYQIKLKTCLHIYQSQMSMKIWHAFFHHWLSLESVRCANTQHLKKKGLHVNWFFLADTLHPLTGRHVLVSTYLIVSLTFMDRESSCLHLDSVSYIWYLDLSVDNALFSTFSLSHSRGLCISISSYNSYVEGNRIIRAQLEIQFFSALDFISNISIFSVFGDSKHAKDFDDSGNRTNWNAADDQILL